MIRVGRSTSAITLAIVNVLPEPVMPSRTWASLLRRRPSTSSSIARGWSPPGWYGATSLKPALPRDELEPPAGGLLAEPARPPFTPSAPVDAGAEEDTEGDAEAEVDAASVRPPRVLRGSEGVALAAPFPGGLAFLR